MPNTNSPSSGPYVYDAMVYIASMTLVEFMALKATMNSMKASVTPMCTYRRVRTARSGEYPLRSTPRMSMQKLVVRAVSAESALENAAATMPIMNSTGTSMPR